jgi:AraC-like DNA-binding protein
MLRAPLEEFAAAPVGRYVAGDSFAHFCAAPTLWGLILWGRPSGADAQVLGRSLILGLAPPAVPHVTIIDASHMESGDPAAFRAAERYVTSNAGALQKWVFRVALVRPSGMGGAIIAGAYEVLPRPYPVAVFDRAAAAFDWLAGRSGDLPPVDTTGWPADGPALLAQVHAEVTGSPPIVGQLRAYLDGHLGDAELRRAARTLGTSERSLQRKLGEAGTSFKDQLTEARLRAARRMLLDTDNPLTAIAFDVGCSSLQQFSALFRKHLGESPSAFRQRHRGG